MWRLGPYCSTPQFMLISQGPITFSSWKSCSWFAIHTPFAYTNVSYPRRLQRWIPSWGPLKSACKARRGLFCFVSKIAHELFGVVDGDTLTSELSKYWESLSSVANSFDSIAHAVNTLVHNVQELASAFNNVRGKVGQLVGDSKWYFSSYCLNHNFFLLLIRTRLTKLYGE